MSIADCHIRTLSRSLTGAELARRAPRIAGGLRQLGVEAGDAVAALLRNDLPFFEILAGARHAGACFVPINWHLAAPEIEYILHDAGAKVLVLHADLLPLVADAARAGLETLVVETPPEIAEAYGVERPRCLAPAGAIDWRRWLESTPELASPAPAGSVMLYTSGTTGRPKGVKRTPLGEAAQARYDASIARAFGLSPPVRAVMTGPLYHAATFAHARVALGLGGDLLLMPRFDALALLELIQSERLTHMHLVPLMLVRLLRLAPEVRARYDLGSLVCAVHGAAPCPPEIKRRMIEWWGEAFREYYGTTEASVACAIGAAEWLAHPGSVGRPLAGVRLAVFDEAGRRLAPGEVGEIHVRQEDAPDFVYHNHPAARRAVERDGLISNGDLGYQDAEGYVYVCDRKRDMIISGGVNIYPAEVEGAILAHPGVRDCAVFGVPDPEFGERVHAALELENGARLDGEAIRAFLRERIAGFKTPKEFSFHERLPRYENGKIYKQALRAPFWDGHARRI